MKKILYLFSETGGGHRSAAVALTEAIKHLKHGKVAQEMVDVFAECSGFLNIFAKLYAPMIKYTPKFWGKLWYFLDDMKKLERLENMARPFIKGELCKLISNKMPDVIVSVHPMINHLTIQAMKDIGRRIPMITIITDPVTFHRAWIDTGVDQVVVATEEAKNKAIEYGMPEEKIKVFGIPIHPRFALKDKEKARLRVRDHLSEYFTVLMMGGGEGAGKMYDIIKALNETNLKIQLIVIAGRNKKLETKLREEAKRFNFPIKVYGFTDEVPEIMSKSDIIITKAGPGTIAESLAMNLPMIITSWLPGQEEGNIEFVKSEDVGRVCKDPKKVAKIVAELQEKRKEFEHIKNNIKRVRRPHASFAIAKLILKYIEEANL